MPLLTITTSRQLDRDVKETFFEELAASYADVMESETRFLSIRFCGVSREDLWLGRATPDADVVVLEADVRGGRPLEQRREFALGFMEKIHDEWGIPHPNTKVVFTEHEGSQMMGYDRVGGDWDGDDGSSRS